MPKNWPQHLSGFAAHWNKNANAAQPFDVWFLNLFPRQQPFRFNGGGYQTLNFVPSLATMILGLMAGELLPRACRPRRAARRLGRRRLVLGRLLMAGICPLVKRIWTPSWAIFSAGWTSCSWRILRGIDVIGWKAWPFPLVVVGMNSIAMYVIAHLFDEFITKALPRHLGHEVFMLARKAV